VAPSLAELQVRFPPRLVAGEEAANDRLDELLSELTKGQVVKVEVGLRGREIKDRAELKRTLDELEERLGAQLDKGARIRLV
jgi:translation initiation factor IF-3